MAGFGPVDLCVMGAMCGHLLIQTAGLFACAPYHHHHHQSLNREGRWGTTNDFFALDLYAISHIKLQVCCVVCHMPHAISHIKLQVCCPVCHMPHPNLSYSSVVLCAICYLPVSYTHLTLPTNAEV